MTERQQLGQFYLTGDHNRVIETRADMYVLAPLLHRLKSQNIGESK